MKQIAKWISGSKLYGTSTPSSDTDYAGIFKESLSNIILKTDIEQRKFTTGDDQSRNTSEDVDSDEKELRVFIKDCMAGQSYALEGLFIPKESLLETSNEYEFLVKHRSKLLGDLKPIVSYCKNQAQVFSKKAENISSLDSAIRYLENPDNRFIRSKNLNEILLGEMELWLDDYCKVEEGNSENPMGFYRVGSTLYQLNLPVSKILEAIKAKRNKYGKRAEAAVVYNGKAYSHAFRLAYEYQMLATTGELILPLPQAEFLKQVKLKEFSKEEVQDKLEVLMDNVLSLPSVIGTPDKEFWDDWILETYKK